MLLCHWKPIWISNFLACGLWSEVILFTVSHNAGRVIRNLNTRRRRLDKMRTPLRQASDRLRRIYRRIHFSEVLRAERRIFWEARKRYYPWPIMRKSGRLAESYRNELVSDMKAKIFTTVPYARPHHTGAPERNLPMRRTMTITMEDIEDLTKRIKRHLRIGGLR